MASVLPSSHESTEDEAAINRQIVCRQQLTTLKLFTFDYEPSKLETQLKENIQRLNTPADETGRRLDNNKESVDEWEIPFQDIRDLEYVGSGGQGTVFRGIHRGQMVAVKKVNDPKQTNIHHLRKLEHSNIIKFLGVCTKEPCYCIVMEYCSGGNVYQYIRQPNVIMLPKQVVNWARQVASGMKYLHSNRIIHRDLKSLNVLVKKNGYLKITDFGTSRLIDSHATTTVMTVIGSCAWMAPEMIRNEPCNGKVDVWSYGILLWELLTQEVPYKGLNHGAIMFGVGSNRLSLPIPEKCPTELKELLNKCWEPKAKNRPSFHELLGYIDKIKQGTFLSYTAQDYMAIRARWKQEIDNHFDTLEMNLNSQSSDDYHLIIQRKEELKHAQEVRIMYEKKLETAERLCEQLDLCKRLIDQRQNELDRKERNLTEKLELYKAETYYSSTSSDDANNSGRIYKTVVRRKRSCRRVTTKTNAGKQKDSISTPDVFDSPVDITVSSPITIPIATNHSPNNSPLGIKRSPSDYKRSESIITNEGNVSPAVQKLINSVTRSRSGQGGVTLARPAYTRHRRVKSCSAIKRRDSKSSVKSLNFHRRHDHQSHDRTDRSHDRLCVLSNSIDGGSTHHKQHQRHRSCNSVTSRESGGQQGYPWNNNGEDGDTESNGEEEQEEEIGDDPMSSIPSSPVDTPKHSTLCSDTLSKQHDISPVVMVTPAPPINSKRGVLKRLLRFRKSYSSDNNNTITVV